MSATVQAALVALVFVGLTAVFSAAESALRTARRTEAFEKLAAHDATARRVGSMRERTSRYIAAVLIADFFATFALAAIAAVYLTPGLSEVLRVLGMGPLASGASAVVITVGVVSVVVIVFGLLLPRAIAARHPMRVLSVLAWPIRLVALFFGPVLDVLLGVTRVLARPFGASPEGDVLVTEEDLKALVATGEEQGVLEREERRMIHSIFEFGDTEAHDVMVPRTDIVGIDAAAGPRDALDTVVRSGHSRIPVYQHSIDDIIGILYAKDLFRLVARGRVDVPLRDIVRPVHYVPETKKVDDLLREMQQRKVHLAIVVDEYGGTSGLVTIEDLIEEIVGEIRDEFEVDEQRVVVVSENEAVMDARVPFDDVNESYDLGVEPSEDYDTLGGFIAHELGGVPKVGDTVRLDSVVFIVEAVSGPRATKVRVKREAAGSVKRG